MPHRSPARFLAPVALVIALFAVYSTIQSTADDDDEPAVTQSTQTTTTVSEKPDGEDGEKPETYTVESGDVLSGIAAETGVSLDRLLELNPDLDPQSLRAGQKITLTP